MDKAMAYALMATPLVLTAIQVLFSGRDRLVATLALGALVVGWLAVGALRGRLGNRTQLLVRAGEVQVRRKPNSSVGLDVYPAGTLRQLFVEVRETNERSLAGRRWALMAERTDGQRVQLLGQLATEAEALWLEQALERALGIVNAPVADAPRDER